MSGGHYLPNRVTAYGSVAEITASDQNPRFLHSQAIQTYELENVHNYLDMPVTILMYHYKYIGKFVFLQQKSAVGP